jgi:hypothetical protein
MQKVIIGFIGDHNVGKTLSSDYLKKKGFLKFSINSKVNEFARFLFSKDEIKQNTNVILNKVRRKGYTVHKEYWINLIMASVHNDKHLVVFDDLSIDEIGIEKIEIYQIVRPNVSTIELPDIKTIINNGSIEELYAKIDKIIPKK